MTKTVRRDRGRFQARYDERTLLAVVAAVARGADPDEPVQVSQSAYDAARASAGYAEAPTAKQTAARLAMSWRELLRFALAPMASPDIALGRHLGERNEDWLDKNAVRAALKTVALRLGKKTLLPADYLEERQRMLDEAARATRHRRAPLLPTEGQIERIAGSWDASLEIAGLVPRPPVGRAHPGVPIVVALELALETTGALPSFRSLEKFAKANGFSLARRDKPWKTYLAELRTARAEWGKWTPSGYASRDARPDWSRPVKLPASFETVRRRRHRWTREECLDALVRLLDELGGERLTLRLYQQKARADHDLPPLTSLQRHGSFTELVAAARKQDVGAAPSTSGRSG